MIVFCRILCAAVAAAALSACVTAPPIAYENPAFDAVTETELKKFESAEAFGAYLDKVQEIDREAFARRMAGKRFAQLFTEPAPVTSDAIPCVDDECEELIIVTGSRITRNPTITNNQKAGVDEGDIVKQIGDYLVVLQDGRLFSARIGEGENGALDFIDRANVYRSEYADTWYDELLVSGDKVVVTGFSYDAEASEIALFSLGEDGKFSLEDTFYISSDDYYSSDNYATRMVGGNFVFHTPIYLSGYDADDALPWPLLRHWNGSFYADRYDDWDDLPSNDLLKAKDIYKPLQGTVSPVVHIVTVCDVAGHKAGAPLDCRSSGFIAPEGYQYYVSERDVFLWTWPNDDDWDFDAPSDDYCAARGRVPRAEAVPAVVFKVPINGDDPTVLRATGRPYDQFSIDTRGDRLRALVDWTDPRCADENEQYHPTLFKGSLRDFADSIIGRELGTYHPLPSYGDEYELENRFTENHLIYSLDDWGRYPPSEGEAARPGSVAVVPLSRPRASTTLKLSHNVARLELVGENALASGYRDHQGLQLSFLTAGRTPRIASTLALPLRYESEGRSHAFNYLLDDDGDAILGLPTVKGGEDGGRWWWRSDSSDVSFMALEGEALSSLGALAADEEALSDDYDCEVSCVDWYGNTRPVFTEGRIFALSGVELIEGVIADGRITERRRLNLSVSQGSAD